MAISAPSRTACPASPSSKSRLTLKNSPSHAKTHALPTPLLLKFSPTVSIQPVIGEKLLDAVTPQDVHDIVYSNKTDVTWYTRRGTLRRIHRIFQMAMVSQK